MVIAIGGVTYPVPLRPTLITPGNSTYADFTAAVPFSFQYNRGQAGETMTNWALVVFEDGSPLAQYYNSGTGMFGTPGGTPHWNAGTTTLTNPVYSFNLAANALANGHSYQWAIATEDSNGFGPFSTLFLLTGQQIPVVSVLEPSGATPNASPALIWSVALAPGASQITYRAIIYNAAQYGAGGFTVGVSDSVFDTGVVGSPSINMIQLAAIPVYLANSTSYRVYVQVVATGAQASAWAYSAFNTDYTAPAAPTIIAVASADPDTGCPLIKLTVSGLPNLLSIDDADPSLGIGSWEAVEGCVLSSTPDGLKLATSTTGLLLLGGTRIGSPVSTVAVSGDDGVTFSHPATDPFGGDCFAVAIAGAHLVAVGNNPGHTVQVAISADAGVTWTTHNVLGSGATAFGVAADGDNILVVGSGGAHTIAYSTDGGSTWGNPGTDPFAGGEGNGCAVSGSVMVAAGNNAAGTITVAVSTDAGTTWNTPATNPFTAGEANCAVISGSLIVIGGSGTGTPTIAYSTDNGVTWTSPVTDPFGGPTGFCQCLAVNSSLVIAGGSNPTSGKTLAYSADGGVTWTSPGTDPFATGECLTLAANDSVIIAGGSSSTNVVAVSTDGGATWASPVSNPFYGQIDAVRISGSYLFAGGPGIGSGTGVGTFATSDDGGTTWVFPATDPFPSASSATYALAFEGGTGSGPMEAQTETFYPAMAATDYSAIASFESASAGEDCTVGLAFYNSSFGLISISTGTAVTDNDTGPTQATVNATSPSLTAYIRVVLTVADNSENHFATEIGLFLGNITDWTDGGFSGLLEVTILRSDGLYVRNASVANPGLLQASQVTTAPFIMPAVGSTVPVQFTDTSDMTVSGVVLIETAGYFTVSSITSGTIAVLTNSGYATNINPGTTVNSGVDLSIGGDTATPPVFIVDDYEAVQTVAYTYQAQLVADLMSNTVVSPPVVSSPVTLNTSPPRWWELDPNNPSGAVAAQFIEFEPQVTEQSTAHLVMGQQTPNVVANVMGLNDGQGTFETFDPNTYASIEALLQSQSTIFVSSPWGPVDTIYVRFGPQTGGMSSGSGNKVKDSTLLPSTAAGMHRTTAVTWTAQARPPV